MRRHAWTHIARTAVALAAAMGIGRFAYTPIFPLMTAHAHLTVQSAAQLATGNYFGYLVAWWPVAGITSALVFVIAGNVLLDHLYGHPAHLPGSAFGGVGVGIALSAAVVSVLPVNAGWRGAWWTRPPHWPRC